MAGTDTIRGISYQQVIAIHRALDIVEKLPGHYLRVEGEDDVIDIETLDDARQLVSVQQVKGKSTGLWTPEPFREILRRWARLNVPNVQFSVITNALLGPGARALSDMLLQEGDGRDKALAKELGITVENASLLADARVVVDPSSVGALLSLAERRVMGLLDPLERDRDAVASQRVDSLFSALTHRAALPNAADRLWSAAELTDLVGGGSGIPSETHWNQLKHEYLRSVVGESALVPLTLSAWGEHGSSHPPEVLLQQRCAILTGSTGSGKSSTVEIARRWAADRSQPVIVCRAEIYAAGRLDSLLADSLGFLLGRAVPAFVGRQILSDPGVTVVIDGASEIPRAAMDELSRDLRSVLTRPELARIVAVGRDAQALRRLLAPAPEVETYLVRSLENDERLLLAKKVLGVRHSDQDLDVLLRRAIHALGDGAGNPLLLRIYLEAMGEETKEVSRSDVYETFLVHLCERASTSARMHLPILGKVFAELLQNERRFADPYEWIARVDVAARSTPGAPAGEAVRQVAQQVGLVAEVGLTGVIVPFHDSIADYLAAVAVSMNLASLPAQLRESDAEGVLFSAELGVNVASSVVRDLPFLSVRVAQHDHSTFGDDGDAARASGLLDVLLNVEGTAVAVQSVLDGRRKIDARLPDGQQIGVAVAEGGRGALYLAVRIWRLALRTRLSAAKSVIASVPRDRDAAERAVSEAARQNQTAILELLEQFPPRQRERLLAEVRPLGLSFVIGNRMEDERVPEWPLTYVSTPEVRVLAHVPTGSHGSTTVRYFLSDGPAVAAQKTVRDAIGRLIDTGGWLT